MQIHKKLAIVAATLAGTGLVGAQPRYTPTVNYASLAEKLVSQSANVKEGDVVEIYGGAADLPLLEELVIAVRKRGGFPLLTLDSEKIAKADNELPAKYDTRSPKLGLALAKLINVRIGVPPVRDPSIAAMLPADRQARRAKAAQPIGELIRRRNVRTVDLDNGFAPSPWRARELGISEAELTKIYWRALDADFGDIETKCGALRKAVAGGKEVHITHPNGTDLTLGVRGRKSFTSDGVTTDAEAKAGGPGVQVWLPAGEVYTTPVAGSAKGKLVDDRFLYLGKEVTGVTVDIAKGKVTAIDAKSGWDVVKPRYDAAGRGKTEVGVIDFGCNPAIKTGGKLESWVGAGMVSIAIGGNVWAGGTNKEPFDLAFQLPGTTVTIDGKTVIEAGVLK